MPGASIRAENRSQRPTAGSGVGILGAAESSPTTRGSEERYKFPAGQGQSPSRPRVSEALIGKGKDLRWHICEQKFCIDFFYYYVKTC